MALKILSITRTSPAPCDHYEIIAEVDGATRTKIIQGANVAEALDDFEFGGYKGALVLAWMRYQLANGATKNDLLNVDIAPIVGV